MPWSCIGAGLGRSRAAYEEVTCFSVLAPQLLDVEVAASEVKRRILDGHLFFGAESDRRLNVKPQTRSVPTRSTFDDNPCWLRQLRKLL